VRQAKRLRCHLLDCAEKLDEILAAAAEPTLRPDIADADSRAATVKQRPTSRRITPAEISVSHPWSGAPKGWVWV
jgi:SH3/ankyrin repeat-containing protein